MKKINLFMMLALLTFAWGCGSDDDEPTPENKTEELLTVGNAERPDWAVLDNHYDHFELTMSVQFQLQEVLAEYVSDQDLMCAKINDEVRAVTPPDNSEGQVYFPLTIAASSGDTMVSIEYYCDKLKRIYTIDNWHSFDESFPLTNDGVPYVLEFIKTTKENQ